MVLFLQNTSQSAPRMAAVGPENLAWSLPVPSVKELAVQRLETVPPQYIRDDVDNTVTTPSNPSGPVPLIDMAKLANPESQEAELQKLHSACKDSGLFQIINHGVIDESLNNMKKQLQEFSTCLHKRRSAGHRNQEVWKAMAKHLWSRKNKS
ncbi:hypothetical protein L1049_011929 [Liquidambar formosana]|uniref:Non-haem dioxygenase N-terminal domain-containing protein n=1 Tax=Liquidambar formosana TaxID=63359 RepID=A0AAP0RT74_LIQFO